MLPKQPFPLHIFSEEYGFPYERFACQLPTVNSRWSGLRFSPLIPLLGVVIYSPHSRAGSVNSTPKTRPILASYTSSFTYFIHVSSFCFGSDLTLSTASYDLTLPRGHSSHHGMPVSLKRLSTDTSLVRRLCLHIHSSAITRFHSVHLQRCGSWSPAKIEPIARLLY